MYNEGISREGNILDIAVNEDIINKSGTWFSYKDMRLGQGRENSKTYLKENKDLAFEVENAIRKKYNLPLVKLSQIQKGESNKKDKTKNKFKSDKEEIDTVDDGIEINKEGEE